ncbi:MAG: RNA polymerase sigma factor [Hyphomicrobiaceae bacterium]
MKSATLTSEQQAMTDVEIVQRIAGGDDHAFTLLMRRHNQKMYRTARSILRDDAEAEDAVQGAYLLAYRAIDTFRGDAKLSTWLVRIVVNEAVARMRKRSRTAKLIQLSGDTGHDEAIAEVQMDESPFPQPEQAALRAEARRLLEAKIDALPDAFRTVFVLRAVEEMSVEEAAISLGISQVTVRTRYFRAKSLLREALAREIDFAFEEAFAFAGERCNRIVASVWAQLKGPGQESAGHF